MIAAVDTTDRTNPTEVASTGTNARSRLAVEHMTATGDPAAAQEHDCRGDRHSGGSDGAGFESDDEDVAEAGEHADAHARVGPARQAPASSPA